MRLSNRRFPTWSLGCQLRSQFRLERTRQLSLWLIPPQQAVLLRRPRNPLPKFSPACRLIALDIVPLRLLPTGRQPRLSLTQIPCRRISPSWMLPCLVPQCKCSLWRGCKKRLKSPSGQPEGFGIYSSFKTSTPPRWPQRRITAPDHLGPRPPPPPAACDKWAGIR